MQDPKNIKVIAKPFYRSARDAFYHANSHLASEGTESDAVQVILSLDYSVEMLLKSVLMNRGDDIMPKKGQSLSLPDALERCPEFTNAPSIKILRDRRNSLQHSAAPTQIDVARELYETTTEFINEVLDKEYDIELDEELKLLSGTGKSSPASQVIKESSLLQRDVAVSSMYVFWAEGDNQNLSVFMKDGNELIKLSPSSEFEHMPVANDKYGAVYIQGGGIALYDTKTRKRKVLSDKGLPNSMNGNWLSAQGINVVDGVASGISLYDLESHYWTHVTTGSCDNSRLTSDYIFWNEFADNEYRVMYRQIAGGEIKIFQKKANWASPTDELVAWTKYPDATPTTYVSDYDGKDVFEVANSTFPYLSEKYLTYLELINNNRYSLVLVDIITGDRILDEKWVGFPMGRGPIIAGDYVYFETRADNEINKVMKLKFK